MPESIEQQKQFQQWQAELYRRSILYSRAERPIRFTVLLYRPWWKPLTPEDIVWLEEIDQAFMD